MNLKANENSNDCGRVLVVGASGRMTAAMLSRLGFACSVADLFGDWDTGMICDGRVTKLSRLNDLHLHEQLVREHDYVVFCGGLEGHPGLAEKVAQWTGRSFASPASIAKVNDHSILNKALKQSGLEQYLLQRNPMKVTLPAIAKSLRGSGRALRATHWGDCLKGIFRGRVFQNEISGQVVSQIFVGDGSSAKALGGSTQLSQSMSWMGSVSGLVLSKADQESSVRLANRFVELTVIQGVFGVDFVRNEGGLWPIDFNPRIPASAEVVGGHVLREHMVAFGIDVGIDVGIQNVESSDVVQGKLVVFNTSAQPMRFELGMISGFPFRHQSSFADVSVADIPFDGEIIKPRRPILTVFVSGKCATEVEAELMDKSREIQHRLCLQAA